MSPGTTDISNVRVPGVEKVSTTTAFFKNLAELALPVVIALALTVPVKLFSVVWDILANNPDVPDNASDGAPTPRIKAVDAVTVSTGTSAATRLGMISASPLMRGAPTAPSAIAVGFS